MQTMTTLWAVRHSIARGTHIVAERQCEPADAPAWLRVFQGDEAEIPFAIGQGRPPKRDAFRRRDDPQL